MLRVTGVTHIRFLQVIKLSKTASEKVSQLQTHVDQLAAALSGDSGPLLHERQKVLVDVVQALLIAAQVHETSLTDIIITFDFNIDLTVGLS